jgi:hypothetical protein
MIPALSCKNIKEKQQPTQPQIDLQVSIIWKMGKILSFFNITNL